jgi:hypothetical protein
MEKKQVRPWDIFNKNANRVLPILEKERLDICRGCPEFIKLTGQCKECGCVMYTKVKIAASECPLEKWKSVSIPMDKEIEND